MLPVKISWSGGKDSTASMLLHYFLGIPAYGVVYVPMLTDSIPLISKAHHDFILSAAGRFDSLGIPVYFASGVTFYDLCHYASLTGKNAGVPVGYATGFGFCRFRNRSKIAALKSVDTPAFCYEDIGIAADETKRLAQLNDKERSILVEYGYTEQDAFAICQDYDFLSPNYLTSRRDGCAICPNAKDSQFFGWLSDYPEAKNILLEIDSFVLSAPRTLQHYPYRKFNTFRERIEGHIPEQYTFGYFEGGV